MSASVVLSFIVLIGLVIYCVPSHPKLEEIGRVVFFCSLLALMFVFAGKVAFHR